MFIHGIALDLLEIERRLEPWFRPQWNYVFREPCADLIQYFINRRRTHLKLLVWDRSGYVLYYQRLEEGTFEIPASPADGTLSWQQLVLILEGVSLESARYRKRYRGPDKRAA